MRQINELNTMVECLPTKLLHVCDLPPHTHMHEPHIRFRYSRVFSGRLLTWLFCVAFWCNRQVIGIGSLHCKHGYEGLKDAGEHLNMTVPLLLLDVRERSIKDDMDVIETWDSKEKQLTEAMEEDRLLSGPRFFSVFHVCFHPRRCLPSLHFAQNLFHLFSFDHCFNIWPASRRCPQKTFGR